MKIMVTGSAGFIGSHLVDRLNLLGHDVIPVDDFSSGTNKHSNTITYTFGDGLMSWWDGYAVDVVFHLAAWGSVPRSFIKPGAYIRNNVMGTFEAIEVAKKLGAKKFIFASSSSVYGDDPEYIKVVGNEGRCLSPYASSKRMGEDLVRQLWSMELFNLRFFNVYGPRQRHDHQYAAVIPKWIHQIKAEKKITANGDPNLIMRDFTYVDDVVDALIACLDSPGHLTLNIGEGRGKKLQSLINILKDKMGEFDVVHGPRREGDIPASIAYVDSTHDYLKWKVKTSFEDGVQRTIDCFNL